MHKKLYEILRSILRIRTKCLRYDYEKTDWLSYRAVKLEWLGQWLVRIADLIFPISKIRSPPTPTISTSGLGNLDVECQELSLWLRMNFNDEGMLRNVREKQLGLAEGFKRNDVIKATKSISTHLFCVVIRMFLHQTIIFSFDGLLLFSYAFVPLPLQTQFWLLQLFS